MKTLFAPLKMIMSVWKWWRQIFKLKAQGVWFLLAKKTVGLVSNVVVDPKSSRIFWQGCENSLCTLKNDYECVKWLRQIFNLEAQGVWFLVDPKSSHARMLNLGCLVVFDYICIGWELLKIYMYVIHGVPYLLKT